MNRPTQHRGMTLIELLIVISIIAILAAIVIPNFSNASDTAKGSSLASQLSIVNKAMVLYKTDHNDNDPTEAQLVTNPWQVLTNSTDVDGLTSGSDYGPYFKSAPMNSFQGSNVIATDNSGAWQYDASTGKIRAVVPQAVYDDASAYQLDQSDLVVEP